MGCNRWNIPISSPEFVHNLDIDEEEDEWDSLCCRDVFFADLLPGEPEIAPDLRSTFESEGFSIRRVEAPPTHPVLVLHAICKGAVATSDQRSLLRHLQSVLRRAGFRLRSDELVVGRRGKGLIIAFLWKDSPVDARPTAEELEAQYEPIP